jgi:hypothetical protein
VSQMSSGMEYLEKKSSRPIPQHLMFRLERCNLRKESEFRRGKEAIKETLRTRKSFSQTPSAVRNFQGEPFDGTGTFSIRRIANDIPRLPLDVSDQDPTQASFYAFRLPRGTWNPYPIVRKMSATRGIVSRVQLLRHYENTM